MRLPGRASAFILLFACACASNDGASNAAHPGEPVDAEPEVARRSATAEATAAEVTATASAPEPAARPEAVGSASPSASSAAASSAVDSSPATATATDREAVQKIVRQNFGRIRFCYENALRKTPDLKGKVAATFTIGAAGDVTDAAASSTISDREMIECITKVIRGLSFPKPKDGKPVRITYPFVFDPGA